ncbi:hypothetical protein Tsubulata_011309 [Turnera subulata]|uniref:Tropinone reductase-like 1 n=1 Tax=Turnera subulata TaxID=218843 RepID=A0A9Q0FVE8_9ROSI|nr:hypothetical protein Tsubulata_011309 [Turnera subulata]
MAAASLSAPSQRLAGKVAIITGGASGIGESAVHLFHENGSKVVIADVEDDRGQAIAAKLGENVCYIHCDVSKEDDVCNLIDATIAKYGKLDIMYNNAGVIDRVNGSVMDTKKSELDRVISINLVGAFLGAKYAAKVMVPQGQGNILFTASACTGIAGIGTPAYAVTKYGILGLVKSLAAELGQFGIRVNCVSPFAVVTRIAGEVEAEGVAAGEALISGMGNLKGHVLKPEDVARAALYLASDEAQYVSGLNLMVDGGFSVVSPTMMNAAKLGK